MTINFSFPGTCGTDAGPNSDGVLVGSLAESAIATALLESRAGSSLVITDDGGLYVDETTPANEATANDVEIVGATLAANDAIYFGATSEFTEILINITTQGDYTDPVWAWEYWNGTAWTAVANLVDGTNFWEAAAGTVQVSYDAPTDWAQNTVDNVLAYWIRANCTSVTATVTQCLIGQVWIVGATPAFTNDTVDINDADVGDVDALPATAALNDAFYYGMGEKFCKLKITTSQARTGTATLTWEYWNGSAWAALGTVEDKSDGYAATAGTHMVSFAPPSDWVANTAANGPDGEAGFFVRSRLSAFTSVTQQPLITQAFAFPVSTGAVGVPRNIGGQVTDVTCDAVTVSGANNDSVFLLINADTGASEEFTWTQATKTVASAMSIFNSPGASYVVAQIVEDGTTEFASVSFYVR